MKKGSLSPQARKDLLESTRWIAADNPDAARAFRKSVDQALITIGSHPKVGVEKPELAGFPIRFFPLTSFPYVFVYDSEGLPPMVLRVLHGVRDLPELLKDLSFQVP